MQKAPTYSAQELHKMCKEVDLDLGTFDVLSELICEEVDLYTTTEDLELVASATVILTVRILFRNCIIKGL